jgi:hypothetical protein
MSESLKHDGHISPKTKASMIHPNAKASRYFVKKKKSQ